MTFVFVNLNVTVIHYTGSSEFINSKKVRNVGDLPIPRVYFPLVHKEEQIDILLISM